MPRPFLLMPALLVGLTTGAAEPALRAQPAQPPALDRMVAAERGFAAATRLMGVRDGFLTFFLPDALDIVRTPAGLALQPGPSPFARSFVPAPAPARPPGAAPPLADAERAFQESAATGLVGTLRCVAAPEVRRDRLQPLAGLEAVLGAIGDIYAGMRWKTRHVETAESGDLGFTIGSYDNSREQGGWARIWHLDASGRWTLVFDTAFT